MSATPTVCVLAIFKNEGHVLREWLDHYRRFGVSHFFLGNNNSTDNFQVALEGASDITLIDVSQNHYQMQFYNNMISAVRAYTWCIIVDLDEFMYPRNGWTSFPAYLSKVDHRISQIWVFWKMFASSGHVKQPSSVIKGFQWRWADLHKNFKCLVRTANIVSLNVHNHGVSGTTVRESNNIHLNHYIIQSREYYETVKMSRGDVAKLEWETHRDWAYFDRHDKNEVLDDELAKMTP